MCENCFRALATIAGGFKAPLFHTVKEAQDAGFEFADVDDAAWYWHTNNTENTFPVFLGMKEEEYEKNVLCGEERNETDC